jgi:apolipoprotein D and lipocalin family protein
MKLSRLLATPCVTALLLVGGCAHASQPIPPVSHVDLSRYMGRWYVIASIPTRFERGGYNPVETYKLDPDGRVCTAFRFRPGSFSAPVKKIHSIASVVPGTGNAQWKVHLFWFLRAQYIVAWLAPDYSKVIVARDKRDYVWLMARTPHISEADYQAMLARVKAMGYDLSKLEKAPQQWPEAQPTPDSFVPSCP